MEGGGEEGGWFIPGISRVVNNRRLLIMMRVAAILVRERDVKGMVGDGERGGEGGSDPAGGKRGCHRGGGGAAGFWSRGGEIIEFNFLF